MGRFILKTEHIPFFSSTGRRQGPESHYTTLPLTDHEGHFNSSPAELHRGQCTMKLLCDSQAEVSSVDMETKSDSHLRKKEKDWGSMAQDSIRLPRPAHNCKQLHFLFQESSIEYF